MGFFEPAFENEASDFLSLTPCFSTESENRLRIQNFSSRKNVNDDCVTDSSVRCEQWLEAASIAQSMTNEPDPSDFCKEASCIDGSRVANMTLQETAERPETAKAAIDELSAADESFYSAAVGRRLFRNDSASSGLSSCGSRTLSRNWSVASNMSSCVNEEYR